MKILRAGSLKTILVILSTASVMAAAAVGGARGTFFLQGPDDVAAVQEGGPQECEGEGVREEEGAGTVAGEPDVGPAEGEIPEGAASEGPECEPAEDGADQNAPDQGEEGRGGSGSDEMEDPPGRGRPGTAIWAERDAECDAAAGLGDAPLPEGRPTGLDHAITRVLENCKKNPQAPGLLVALERLAENRAKHQARMEARAGEIRGRGLAPGHPGKGWPVQGGPPGLAKRGMGASPTTGSSS